MEMNAVSKFDTYPMSRFDELLYRLGSIRFYLTLDLKKKTAFTTPFGLHKFITLLFGLFKLSVSRGQSPLAI